MAALALDAVGIGGSFVPGYGDIIGGVAGVGSTVADFLGDLKDGYQGSDG